MRTFAQMIKGLWRDNVVAGVIVSMATAGGVVTYFWALIRSISIAGLAFLQRDTSIPNWLISLLIFTSLPALLLILELIWNLIRPTKQEPKNWKSYTSDTFFGLRWRWDYSGMQIVRLSTFCPHCDFQIFSESDPTYMSQRVTYKCDGCYRKLSEFNEGSDLLESKVERSIQQKL